MCSHIIRGVVNQLRGSYEYRSKNGTQFVAHLDLGAETKGQLG
jgi:hypothetical protein